MSAQFLHKVHRIRVQSEGLGLEPFVQRQRIGAITVIENIEGSDAFGALPVRQYAQCGLTFGHVVGAVELLKGR